MFCNVLLPCERQTMNSFTYNNINSENSTMSKWEKEKKRNRRKGYDRGKCRSRSDCTYAHADIALHSQINPCSDRKIQLYNTIFYAICSLQELYVHVHKLGRFYTESI